METPRSSTHTRIRSQIHELFALSQILLEKSKAARTNASKSEDGGTMDAAMVGSEPQTSATKEIPELRSRGIALNMHMRSLVAKHLEARLKLEEELREMLSRVDKLNLQLQSSSYEKTSLLRKIAECNSIDVESAVELLPLDEYTTRTGDMLHPSTQLEGNAAMTIDGDSSKVENADGHASAASFSDREAQVQHEFLMRRLHYELRERRKLHGQIEKIRAHKEALAAVVKDRDLTLTRVKNRLESLIQTSESYRSELDSASESVSHALPIVELDLSPLPSSMQIPATSTVDVTPKSSIKSEIFASDIDLQMHDGLVPDESVKSEIANVSAHPLQSAFEETRLRRTFKADPRALHLPTSLCTLYALATACARIPQARHSNFKWEVVILPTPTSFKGAQSSHMSSIAGKEEHLLSDDQRALLLDLTQKGSRLSSLTLALVLVPSSQVVKTEKRLPAILLSEAVDLEMVVCRLAVVIAKSTSATQTDQHSTNTSSNEMTRDADNSRSNLDLTNNAESKQATTDTVGSVNDQSRSSAEFGDKAREQNSSMDVNRMENLIAEYEVIEVFDAAPVLSRVGGEIYDMSEEDEAHNLLFPLLEACGLLRVDGPYDGASKESDIELARQERLKFLTESIFPPQSVGRAFEWLQSLAMLSHPTLPVASSKFEGANDDQMIGTKRDRRSLGSRLDRASKSGMNMNSFLHTAERCLSEWSVPHVQHDDVSQS